MLQQNANEHLGKIRSSGGEYTLGRARYTPEDYVAPVAAPRQVIIARVQLKCCDSHAAFTWPQRVTVGQPRTDLSVLHPGLSEQPCNPHT